MNTHFKKYSGFIFLVIILILATYLRLWRIADYLTFLGDEGRDVLIVKRMIVDGKFTLLGPTASVGGFFMGPAYYYFMTPFLWLWQLDPVGPAIGVGLVGVATVYLVYLLGRSFGSAYTGYISALLYALSPVVVRFSRSSWNPNIVPFFSTALLLLLLRVTRTPTKRIFFLIGITLGVGVQLHYVFLFLYALVAVWMLIVPSLRKDWKGYGWIVAGVCAGLSPMILFEIRHDFSNSKGIIGFLTSGKDTGFSPITFISTGIEVYYRLFARLLLRLPDELQLAQVSNQMKSVWFIGGGLVSAAAFAVQMRTIKKVFSFGMADTKLLSAILLPLWALVTLVFFGLYRKNIYDYYFGIVFAYPFISIALLLEWIKQNIRIRAVWIVIVLAFSVFLWEGRPFKFDANRQLKQAETIAQAVVEKTNNKPFNFALIAGTNSDHAYRYFFEIWNRTPVTIENMDNDPERKTVTDQLLVVCENPSCEPIGNSLWEIAGFGQAEIAGVWDVSVVKIYRLIHYQESKNTKKTHEIN